MGGADTTSPQVSGLRCRFCTVIPKLRARVRFPVARSTQKPRSQIWAFLVLPTAAAVVAERPSPFPMSSAQNAQQFACQPRPISAVLSIGCNVNQIVKGAPQVRRKVRFEILRIPR